MSNSTDNDFDMSDFTDNDFDILLEKIKDPGYQKFFQVFLRNMWALPQGGRDFMRHYLKSTIQGQTPQETLDQETLDQETLDQDDVEDSEDVQTIQTDQEKLETLHALICCMVGTIEDKHAITDTQLKELLKLRSALIEPEYKIRSNFGCLGEACRERFQTNEHFKFFFTLTTDEKVERKEIGKAVLYSLTTLVGGLRDEEATAMLVLFLNETVFPFQRQNGKYEDLIKKLDEENLIPNSLRKYIPTHSDAHGRHKNKKKTPEMVEHDNMYKWQAVKFFVGLLTKCFGHHEIAMRTIEHTVDMESLFQKVQLPKGELRDWFKFYFSYNYKAPVKATAAPTSLVHAFENLDLSEQPRDVFGEFHRTHIVPTDYSFAYCIKQTGIPSNANKKEKALTGTLYNIRDFRIIEYLGRGSFGIVFLAHHKNNPLQKFVLKLQAVDLGLGQDVDDLRNEIILQSNVDSKYVAKVLGFFHVPEFSVSPSKTQTFAIMMEYCNSTLQVEMEKEEIQSLSFPFKMLWGLNIIRQVLSAVEAMRKKGIIHRDLKPVNICLKDVGGGQKLVKVVDFGLSRKIPTEGTVGMSVGVGTAGFRPLRGRSTKHDLISTALMLCYFLRGRPCDWTNDLERHLEDERLKEQMKQSFPNDIGLAPWEEALGSHIRVTVLIDFFWYFLELDDEKPLDFEAPQKAVQDLIKLFEEWTTEYPELKFKPKPPSPVCLKFLGKIKKEYSSKEMG